MKKYSRLKERERDLRKNLILDTAQKLYASSPYDKISMKNIAEEVGFSPGSLYTYFPNQESLLAELVIRNYSEISNHLDDFLKEGNPSIFEISKQYIDLLMDKYEILRMTQNFMVNGNYGSPELIEKITNAKEVLLSSIDPVMNRYVSYDKVRPYSETFLSSLNGIILNYARNPILDEESKKEKMKEIASITCELFEGKMR